MRLPRFLAISVGWCVEFVGPVGSSHSHHADPAVDTSQPTEGQAPPGSILFSVPVGVHATKKTKKKKRKEMVKGTRRRRIVK